MKLRKNWKRFWALDRHHAEGFTLVELIVVIAILAILGGVAIPAYSGYVKKANMQADMTLISEIEHALTLAGYAGTFAENETGYVVLSASAPYTSAQAGEGSNLDKALKATFGDGYALQLAYDDWAADSSMLSWLLGNHDDGSGNSVPNNTYEEIVNIANSSFLTGNTTDELMTNVENLTTKLAGIVASMDDAGKQAVYDKFKDANGNNTLDSVLEKHGYSSVMEVDTTTLSNLVVLAAAEEMKNIDSDTDTSGVSQMANYVSLYSMYTAYASNENSSQAYKDSYDKLQSDIQSASDPVAIHLLLENFAENITGNDAGTILPDAGWENYSGNGSYSNDVNAFAGIMDAVANADVNGSDLQDETLFTQGAANTLFSSYVSSVDTIRGMSKDEYNALANAARNGGVSVIYSQNGNEVRVDSSLPEAG